MEWQRISSIDLYAIYGCRHLHIRQKSESEYEVKVWFNKDLVHHDYAPTLEKAQKSAADYLSNERNKRYAYFASQGVINYINNFVKEKEQK